MNSKDRYAFFSSFKQTHGLLQYLLAVTNVALKRNLIRLRLGVSFLKSLRLHFSETTQENLDCPFCKDTYESELHFLLVCQNYSALRKTYTPAKFSIRPLAFKMALLLADIRLITALSNYVSKALDLRNARSICLGP